MSVFQVGRAHFSCRRAAVAGCVVALLVASAGPAEAGASAGLGGTTASTGGEASSVAMAKKRKCKKGYRLVKVRIKVRRGGKAVTVKVKRCRKRKKRAIQAPVPVPSPSPAPSPGPTPIPSAPRIDQIMGWSTLAQDPDTPPADIVADGGTITTCTTTNSLSVYIRRSGFTSIGLVSHVWKRDGAVIASGTNSNTYEGAFRYGITISPINGVYEITWSSGGSTIATAKITRAC
jgi:hypothetical protein